MKSKFSLHCVLGSAIFLSHLTSGIAASPTEQHLSFASSEEIQEYANGVTLNILKTADAILSVPHDQRTFENTLRPWKRLYAKLSQNFNTLDALAKSGSHSSMAASAAFDDLGAFLLKVIQNPQFYQTLMNCSQRIAHNTELDPFQRYIATRFIKNGSHEPIYLCGSSEEKNSSTVEFTALNLKCELQPEDNVSDLARGILSENADLVYIQEVFADDDAYNLYEFLRDDYAHFIYVPAVDTSDLPRNHHDRGLLIASKYFSLLHQFPTNMKFGILPIKSRSNRDENKGEQRYEGGITGKWGEGKGVQWEGYIKGEARDGKGNYAEGKITQKDDGTGEVDVRGGHESQKK